MRDDAPVILVVDDAPDMLSLLTDILENAGMTALVARSGTAALALLHHAVPDLVLMDAVMPHMDGFETCRAIKQDAGFAHLPLIFMTGLSDAESVVKGFEAGGVDYITKPVVPDILLARIRVHLANARLADSARVALDLSGTPLMAVNAQGDVIWMTPEAARIFEQTMGTSDPGTAAWTTVVLPVMAQIAREKPVQGQALDMLGGAIAASYAGEARGGEYLIRLSARSRISDNEILCEQLNLTGREAEVLLWIAQGKSNRDVAGILACSPRTVNKHLEQIYSKLQVDNRTAAAMQALRILTRARI